MPLYAILVGHDSTYEMKKVAYEVIARLANDDSGKQALWQAGIEAHLHEHITNTTKRRDIHQERRTFLHLYNDSRSVPYREFKNSVLNIILDALRVEDTVPLAISALLTLVVNQDYPFNSALDHIISVLDDNAVPMSARMSAIRSLNADISRVYFNFEPPYYQKETILRLISTLLKIFERHSDDAITATMLQLPRNYPTWRTLALRDISPSMLIWMTFR